MFKEYYPFKSYIDMYEVVKNKDPHHLAQRLYYPCIVYREGRKMPALFTENQLLSAIHRASRNPEDIPKKIPWWKKIFK